jgi:transcription initiation factor TFIIIB Brf1 subunit/transcription initiation factor TFIIB
MENGKMKQETLKALEKRLLAARIEYFTTVAILANRRQSSAPQVFDLLADEIKRMNRFMEANIKKLAELKAK